MKKYRDLIDKLTDKTLSFGCRVRIMAFGEMESWEIRHAGLDKIVQIVSDNEVLEYDGFDIPFEEIRKGYSKDLEWQYEILGHPILIGDIIFS